MSRLSGHFGFTLIELLVTLGIVAIVLSAVLTALNPARRLTDARDAARSAEERMLEQAFSQLAIVDETSYRLILDTLLTLQETPQSPVPMCRFGVTSSACVSADVLVPAFVSMLPQDPVETDPELSGYAIYQTSVGLGVMAMHMGRINLMVAGAGVASSSMTLSSSGSLSSVAGSDVILTLSTEREIASSARAFTARVTAKDAHGNPVSGLAMLVEASESAVGSVTEESPGVYAAAVTPGHTDHVITLIASAAGKNIRRDVIVLSEIDAAWDQPELVTGVVNTSGYEDSAEVSPDGQWLIVSTYSPVSLLCCAEAEPGWPLCPETSVPRETSAACENARGPITAPERPGMRGAGRVLSPTDIVHDIPSMLISESSPEDLPMPPVGAYLFQRQVDDSFGNPKFLGFEMDGYARAPYGMSFFRAPADGLADIIFSFDDPVDTPDSGSEVYETSIALASENILGTYVARALRNAAFDPLTDLPGAQGNPHRESSRLWFDSDAGAQDLFVSTDNGSGFGAYETVGVSSLTVHESDPFMDGTKLYFTANEENIMHADYSGGNIRSALAWTPPDTVLGISPAASPIIGDVIRIGEPSIARIDGQEWLYFVIVSRTPTGLNADVARVQKR